MKEPKKKQVRKTRKQPARRAQNPKEDSEAIERAVYDGMQDLRTKKPAGA